VGRDRNAAQNREFPSMCLWHFSCQCAFEMERTLFIDDAARLLGVSRRTVYYRITQGRLQTIRTRCGSRRVLLSSIEALLREEVEKRRERTGAAAAAPLACGHPAILDP
jgi:excisionase family DNA binding protein